MWVYNQNGHVVTPPQKQDNLHYKNNSSYNTQQNSINALHNNAKQNHKQNDALRVDYNASKNNHSSTASFFDANKMRFSDDEPFTKHAQEQSQPLQNINKTQQAKQSIKIIDESSIKNNKGNFFTLFFATYLVGAIIAGVMFGLLKNDNTQFFINFVAEHFEFLKTSSFLQLLIYYIWLCAISLTLVFLCGLCALGLPLIMLLLAVKGIADSIILIAYFLNFGSNGALDYFILFGIHNMILLACSFIFANTASKNSQLIFSFTCMQKTAKTNKIFKKLRGQYLVFLILNVALAFLFASIKNF